MSIHPDSVRRFDEVASLLPGSMRGVLEQLPAEIKSSVFEIRLRCGQPVMLSVPGDPMFLTEKGSATYLMRGGLLRCSPADLADTFRAICGYSVYSHQHEINAGFVILEGGHRAGLCGTAVLSGGEIINMKDISSVNLRIAREMKGVGEPVLNILRQQQGGLLIAGAPGSGKTTVLRDLARLLGGGSGPAARVVVIDERGELAAVHRGICRNDLGYSTDIISGCPKPQAIQMAVRTLSPEYIILDELGTATELRQVEEGLNTGVRFITTLHAANRADLLRRELVREICRSGAFEAVALLKSRDCPSKLSEWMRMEDLYAEICGSDSADRSLDGPRILFRVGERQTGAGAFRPPAADC